MILKMKQEHSASEGVGVKIEYSFYKGNQKIASFYAAEPPIVLPAKFEGNYKGENEYKVVLEKSNNCPAGYKEGMLSYKLKEEDGTKVDIVKYEYNHYNLNNEIIGKIKYITIYPKKKLFEPIKAYAYQEFTFKGEKYEMYDVRINGIGIYYCIYKNNELVAIVERNLNVKNWLDNYTIYSLNEIDEEFLYLATAHYDYVNFEERIFRQSTGTYHTESGNGYIEFRKNILDKFNPEFIKRIIEMEK